jgi:transcriptional regulator with XRE-family HTH domain
MYVMNIGGNIKRLREDRGIKQSEIADLIGMHRSNYSKIESGQREISVPALDKLAKYFNVSLDDLVHLGDNIPQEVSVGDKTTVEQVKLIQELDQEEKNMVFKMIETFLTKKKFKDFFQKNVAAL